MNVILLVIILFITSCNKDHTSPNFSDFPATVGTNWKYVVYDSIHNYADTQIVVISGETTLNNGRAAKIVKSYFIFNSDTTYTYLVEDASKVIFYTDKEGYDYNKIYVYPLKIGAWWQGENILDTSKVISNEGITVPACSFSTYTVSRNYKVTNMAVRENEWYCPGVGVVQRNYFTRNIGFISNKTFSLLSYNIYK